MTKFIRLSAVAFMLMLAAMSCKQQEGQVNENAQAEPQTCLDSLKTPEDFVFAKHEVEKASYLIGVNFGIMVRNYGFDNLDCRAFLQGLKDCMSSKGGYHTEGFAEQFKYDPDEINATLNAYLEKRHKFTSIVNKLKEDSFLETLNNDDSIKKTESGLYYNIIAEGNEVRPQLGDTVFVHYLNRFTNGESIDENKVGDEPAPMIYGRLLPGLNEALSFLGEGGRGLFYIPSSLAFGERGNGIVKPNTTMVYDVEVLRIGKVNTNEE